MTLGSKIICGDSLEIVPTLKDVKLVWADPPDNIGCKYKCYDDTPKNSTDYVRWVARAMNAAMQVSDIAWLSYNANWQHLMGFSIALRLPFDLVYRQFIWHYTFGQNQRNDFVRSYRPILRIARGGVNVYPESVYVPSARQTKYNDKRANSKGKMPDDVWEFPRVCGTHKERKKWHPCQHPKALLRRIVEFSTKPGDLVVDMFAGTGNMFEVCEELDRPCIAIDISPYYCDKMRGH